MIRLNRMLALVLLHVCWSTLVCAEVFVVTSNQDAGEGTLREALERAMDNGDAAPDEIRFALPGTDEASRTITLKSRLPFLSNHLTIDGSTQSGASFPNSDARIRIIPDLDAFVINSSINLHAGVFHGEGIHHFSIYGTLVDGFDSVRNVAQYPGLTAFSAIFLREASHITIGAPRKGNAFLDHESSIYVEPIEWDNGIIKPRFANEHITVQATVANGLVLVYADNDVTIGGDDPSMGNHLFGQHIDITGERVNFSHNHLGIDGAGNNPIERKTTLRISFASDVLIHDNTCYYSAFLLELAVANFSILRNKDVEQLTLGEVGTGTIGTDDINDRNIFRPGVKWDLAHSVYRPAIRIWNETPLNIGKNSMYCAWPAIEVEDSTPPNPVIDVIVNNDSEYSGMATPGADIYIYEDTTDCENCSPVLFYDKVKADAQGRWRITGDFHEKKWVSHAVLNGYTSMFTQMDLDLSSHRPDEITMATCGRADGSLRLLSHNKHVLAVEWFDEAGNFLGDGFELKNVSEGVYYAHALHGNCRVPKFFFVPNNQAVVYDENLVVTQPGCNGEKGSIEGLFYNSPYQQYLTEEWIDGQGRVVGTGTYIHDLDPGSYTLRISGIEGCPTLYGPIVLAKTAGPVLDESNVVVQHTDCNQPTGSIMGIGAAGEGSLSYAWRDAQGRVVATQKDLIAVSAGVYRLEVSDQSACSPIHSASYTIDDLFRQGLTVDVSGITITHAGCNGSGGSISGMHIIGADRYEWIDTTNHIVSTQANPTGLPPGSYRLLVAKGDCFDTYGPYVVEQRMPDVFPTYMFNVIDAYCGLSNGTLTVDLGNGLQPAALRWLDSNGRVVGTGTHIANLGPGRYTLILTDAQGCESEYETYTISETPALAINLTALHIVHDACGYGSGSINNVQVTGGVAPYQYEWHREDGTSVSRASEPVGLTSGRYRLTVTDGNGCVAHSTPIMVENDNGQIEAPQVPSRIALCAPTKVSIPIANASHYEYRLYDSPQGVVPLEAGSGLLSFDVYPAKPTTYYLEAVDGTCVSARVAVQIEISNAGIRIPNNFSPNGDGVNETWLIHGLDAYANATVSIFDRNGYLLFSQRGGRAEFDGRYKGADLPVGAYFYVVDLGVGCEPLKGSISLLR